MKITHIDAVPVTMKMTEAYTITYGTLTEAANVFLRLETDRGIVGLGCAAPDPDLTGETVASVLDQVEKRIRPLLHGADPLRAVRWTDRLRTAFRGQPAAAAMVDLALYDILGKVSGLPLYKILGGFRTRVRTSVTIGILPCEETVSRAVDWYRRGFTIVKLKGGTDLEEDIRRVQAVRERLGSSVRLRFDANQGYSLRQTRRFLEATRNLRLECLEQPLPAADLPMLEKPAAGRCAPVMADESLMTLQDVFRLALMQSVDMINVKVMKVGGIREATRISAAARAAGMRVMAGCMDEAALGIAGGLHLALGTGTVAMVDLDGHLDLVGDPSAGAVMLRNGTLYPSPRPGLGIADIEPV
jgi:L-alanine-DL-glutamate epimerase-like enolase superfamily enzyme